MGAYLFWEDPWFNSIFKKEDNNENLDKLKYLAKAMSIDFENMEIY